MKLCNFIYTDLLVLSPTFILSQSCQRYVSGSFSFSQLNADIWDTTLTSLISYPITNTSVILSSSKHFNSRSTCLYLTVLSHDHLYLECCSSLSFVFLLHLPHLFSTWYTTARVITISYKTVPKALICSNSLWLISSLDVKPKPSQGLTNSCPSWVSPCWNALLYIMIEINWALCCSFTGMVCMLQGFS